jgi:hypothetical protein|tara:strand:+ start:38 stop:274 length:237 start_codon:yes stop_codon:yes gene_type:complete
MEPARKQKLEGDIDLYPNDFEDYLVYKIEALEARIAATSKVIDDSKTAIIPFYKLREALSGETEEQKLLNYGKEISKD